MTVLCIALLAHPTRKRYSHMYMAEPITNQFNISMTTFPEVGQITFPQDVITEGYKIPQQ